jgi:hypothetical protein
MKKVLVVFIICSVFQVFGQSKKLWLKFGDNAFNKKDYPTAIDYYTKVLDDTTVLAELVLPYEVQIVNLKTKDFIQDSTKKSKSKPTTEISKSDYLNHQLASAYRLNFEYQNAGLYY